MAYKQNLKLEQGEKLVCFGTGIIGKRFANVAQEYGLVIDYFCDNAEGKQGTYFFNIPVYSLEELLKKREKLVFLVASIRADYEIFKQLEVAGVTEIYHALIEENYLQDDISNVYPIFEVNVKEHYNQAKDRNPEGVFADVISLSIIDNCTLNCRHCIAQVPYKTEYKRTSLQELKEAVTYQSSYLDGIGRFTISGGEPLLHPELYDMVQYLATKEFIFSILILSNGSILLKEEDLISLDKEKVYFTFTNYGVYSTKLEENVALLRKLKIPYAVVEHDAWFEISYDLPDKETEEELRAKYLECTQRYCPSFRNGYFQRCTMYSYAFENGYATAEELDWVSLDTEKRSLSVIKDEMRKYINQDYLNACKYCKGRDMKRCNIVPVGEQL